MSRWRTERAGIGIGERMVCRSDAAGRIVANQPLLALPAMKDLDKAHRLAQAIAALFAGTAGAPDAKAGLVVADSVARYWMQPPPAAGSLAELKAVAQARSQQLFGAAQRWQVAGDWDARRAFLCAAVPEWVIRGAHESIGSRAQIDAALPLALDRVARTGLVDGWLCISTPSRIALLATAGKRLHSVRSMASDPQAPLDLQLHDAARELRRESLRLQIPLNGAVQWRHLGAHAGSSFDAGGLDVEGIRFVPHADPAVLRAFEVAGTDAESAAVMAALF